MFVREPFRIFFPIAVLAGLVGVSLWPLHFWGVLPAFPGAAHARLMAGGFFGGFVLGFLSTALPRMLSAKALAWTEVALLLGLYVSMAASYAAGALRLGDSLWLGLLLFLLICLFRRFALRKDMPPPGFILVLLALLCAAGGLAVSLLKPEDEGAVFWTNLEHLLLYQGFILLPILGVGAFLLPRFFGLDSRHDFPESRTPPAGWTRRFIVSLATGLLIITTFLFEAAGWHRFGPAFRFAIALSFISREVPVWGGSQRSALGTVLQTALVLLLAGFLAIAIYPALRVSLLHLTLVGGFAVVTFAVATRIIFSHSGNKSRLNERNRWLTLAMSLMLFAMVTRISGDFWPKIMASHYIYGAILWAAAVLLWAWHVLPLVLRPDPDE